MPANGELVHEGMSDGLKADVTSVVGALGWIAKNAPFQAVRDWAVDMICSIAISTTEVSRLDSLTQLPNRRGLVVLYDRLIEEMASLRFQRTAGTVPHALIFLSTDLVGFGDYNLSLGFDRADQKLVDYARILEGSVRRGDVVARIGGDEFLAVVVATKADILGRTYREFAQELESRLHGACDDYNVKDPAAPLKLYTRTYVLTRETLRRRMGAGRPVTLDEIIRRADPKRKRG